RADEIVDLPRGTRVTGRWDEERMVGARLVGAAATLRVGMLRRAAATREADAVSAKDRKRRLRDRVARPGEGHGPRDAMLHAACRDRLDLVLEPADRRVGDAHVGSRVVSDLETAAVEVGDLLPRHVGGLVRPEGEPFGDEERRAESVALEERRRDGVVRLHRVVEGEDDEAIRSEERRVGNAYR